MKATDLQHIASTFCGKMDIWGRATGGLYHHVPPAPSETNTPVLMGCTQDSDTFDNYNIIILIDY